MDMNDSNAAMLEYLAAQGSSKHGDAARARKQQQINMLRSTSRPAQGSYTETAGGQPPLFVAPSALESLGSLGGTMMAGYQQNQNDQAATQSGVDETARFEEMLRRMRQGGQGGAGATPGIAPPMMHPSAYGMSQ